MTICGVIDSNNQLVATIIAEPTDLPREGCTLVEIPNGYYWDGEKVSIIPVIVQEVTDGS